MSPMEKIELEIGGKLITLEKGTVAKQSDSAVWVTCGDTIVLVAVVAEKEPREDADFFPLTVEYREQTSAAGKIPGGFFKREGRPTEKETLTSRLIDRSIRPLFPASFHNEVQVIALVLSADQDNDPALLSVIGASAALHSSWIPFTGPMAAVRVGLVDGQFVINPGNEEIEKSVLNLVLSVTEKALVMMEGSAGEISEEEFLKAIAFGTDKARNLVEIQKSWLGTKKEPVENLDQDILDKVRKLLDENLPEAYQYPEKSRRNEFYKKLEETFLVEYEEEKKEEAKAIFNRILEDKIRRLILNTGQRLDGRGCEEIRPIECQVSLLPRAHGSSLFTRGQTQCLASVTLGAKSDEQIIDGLFEETSKRFMLHYNFPGFSVGEVTPFRAPSRREIGHGALAERSLACVIPAEDVFPYTIRIVANILESNGSSSMATVCAGSLALMDAGVPVSKHVAGVAVGMIMEEDKQLILTDIAGEEDHVGDLDLKIAGTKEGITGFQMDVKTTCFTYEMLKRAVAQSRKGCLEIIEKMNQVISTPRLEVSSYAPKVLSLRIKPEKIGLVIGPGGKTIRGIIEKTGVKIDVSDDGEVRIASPDQESLDKAAAEIKGLTEEAEVGQVYEGQVTRILPFGAFVKILPMQEGMVHISELEHRRVEKVEDVVKIGDVIKVKAIEIDDQGRVNLSRKALLPRPEGVPEPAVHRRPAHRTVPSRHRKPPYNKR